jgi:hypothetical protein
VFEGGKGRITHLPWPVHLLASRGNAEAVRPRLVFVLDCLVLATGAAAVVIELSGGFYTVLAGIRVSGRSPDRALFVALGLLAVRLAIDRGTGFLWTDRDRWRRYFQPQQDVVESVAGRDSASWRHLLFAVLGLCAFGVALLYPQLASMGSVPDLGDPLFSMWRIGWVYRQLLGDPRPLFDANIFYPEPLTLTYSDSMLLPALTAAPLLAAGVHPVVTYNLLMLSGFLLSGITTYLLANRLTGSPRAAFVAAVIYGFYPYRFEHYSHLELQFTYWMPLALLALHRFAATAQLRDALLAALAVVAQLYSSMYYAVFFLFYGTAVFLVLAAARRLHPQTIAKPLAIAGALALVLAVPLARPYMAAQPIKGDRDVPAVTVFSATASDYLRAHYRSALYGPHLLPGRKIERALFPGVIPIVLTAVSLGPPIGVTRLAYASGLLVAFDGSLGFHGLMYPYLYDWFPPLRGLRVPARFSVLVGLSLAILSGFGMRRFLRRLTPRRSQFAFVAVVLALIADLKPTMSLRPVWREPPPIYASLEPVDKIVLAEFPIPGDPFGFGFNTHYMYFSLWHGANMVNGYSGFLPPSYEELARVAGAFPSESVTAFLKQRGVTHVTVNCAFYRDECPQILQAFDGQASLRRVTEGRWQGAPSVLYQLQR